MRTDSTNVAASAQQAARAVISGKFGPEYVPERPPVYRKRSQGRPGSARGDPADRAAARSGQRQAIPFAPAVPALHSDLAAVHRQPDGAGDLDGTTVDIAAGAFAGAIAAEAPYRSGRPVRWSSSRGSWPSTRGQR